MPYVDRQAMRDYQNAWLKHRRDEFFKNKKCSVKECREPPIGLHYKNSEKRFTRTPWSLSEEKFKLFMKNCALMCKVHKHNAWIEAMKKANPKKVITKP